MVERIRDISKDLTEMAEKRKRESGLKQIVGFQASQEAKEFRKKIGDALEFGLRERLNDPSLTDDQRRLIENVLSMPDQQTEEGTENIFREFTNRPIPTAARSEVMASEDEQTVLFEDIQAARHFVLEQGDKEKGGGVFNTPPSSERQLNNLSDSDGAVYSASATPDRNDNFFSVFAENLPPNVEGIATNFTIRRQYSLLVEFAGQPASMNYQTPLNTLDNMPANEYRVVRYTLDRFMERSGLIPPAQESK